jgi:hypothetical protein
MQARPDRSKPLSDFPDTREGLFHQQVIFLLSAVRGCPDLLQKISQTAPSIRLDS